jgi:hypothetical protein
VGAEGAGGSAILMRHTFRFTGVIVFVIVVLMTVSSPHRPARAATPPKKNTQTYHLVFDRPSREGFRSESTGVYRVVIDANGSVQGLNAGDQDEYVDAKYDVIEKVSKLDPHGRPQELRVYFKSLKLKTDSDGSFENAQCVGVPITVSRWPDQVIARDDGEDINPDEMAVLKHLYYKRDPDEPTDDDLLGPDHDVRIGETWKPSASTLSKLMQSKGFVIPDNGINVLLKLSSREVVNSVDCLVVDMTVSCPNVDGFTSVSADLRSAHGSYDQSVRWEIPVDPDGPVMSETETTKSSYHGVVNNNDNIPVQFSDKKNVYRLFTFVKEL